MPGYNPTAIEKKWQKIWQDHKVFAAPSTSDKPKYYALDMFPYPSGAGLHVGHPEGYTATDILSRYKRARGFAVMHPMGWDAFGLPAEQYAVKEGKHPREFTQKNIARFRAQLQAIGFSYDWDREVDTTDPNYYKWTQWIFLQLYDTWFDEKQQKGRPIAELIEEFERENRAFEVDGPNYNRQVWRSMTPAEKRTILARYRLAYEAEVPVNWCPGLGTVLANEEVVDGKSEVGGFPVERRPMKQWILRITAYAQRLLDGLEKLEWSDSLKEMQRNWIGKSEGAEVKFELPPVKGVEEHQIRWDVRLGDLVVFTTRPDTLFGATYMVVAPEHGLVVTAARIQHDWPERTPTEWTGGYATPGEAVRAYRTHAASRSDRERQESTEKSGVFTGFFAVNPVNMNKIPVFTSDYVLMGYGTGAIMAVPAHDERDHEFATKFKLPIVQVVAPRTADNNRAAGGNPRPNVPPITEQAFTEEGTAINSPWIDGLPTPEAKAKITAMLEEKGLGKKTINFKIRDWLFSRQRYWGEPFPLVHLQDGTTVPLADSELPLKLPELEDFKPTGTIDPPLSKSPQWFNVHVVVENGAARVVPASTPNAIPAKRELNTMPQWAGSCWYYIRYLDPQNSTRFVDPAIEKYWLGAPHGNAGPGGGAGGGVDMYIGGVEHAVLHLLYSRFWHKVLFDRGLVSADEPFRRLVNQGLILGEAEYTAFKDKGGNWVSADNLGNTPVENNPLIEAVKLGESQVEKKGDHFILKAAPAIRVDARSFKMSKSRGNVINPDDVIAEYGADSLRMFEMFMGPLEQVKPWSTAGVEGVYRFLQRVWRNLFDENDNPKVVPQASALSPQSSVLSTRSSSLDRPLHRLIKKVTDDIERLSFNTAIPAMMEFNNLLAKAPAVPLEAALTLVRLMEPFAPHFADEAYHRLEPGEGAKVVSVSQLPWPTYDPAKLIDAMLDLPVQINGKLKGRISVPNDADEATVFAAALADPELQKHLAGKAPKKKIYVKGRMVNLVV